MDFKGEIGAEFLDNVKTGFTVGDIYRIIDAGKLGGVDIPFGTFVEWKGTAWEVKKDMQYAVSKTGESLDQAVADVLDDHATATVSEETTMPTAEAANYTVGNYFEQDGEIWKCTAKTDNGDGTWTVEAEKVNGVVPVLNTLVSASSGYRQVNLTLGNNDTKTISVGHKEDIYAECIVKAGDQLVIQIAEDCTDAVLCIHRNVSIAFTSVTVKKGNQTLLPFGSSSVIGVSALFIDTADRVLLTTAYGPEDHGEIPPITPTDFSEVELNTDDIVGNIDTQHVAGSFRSQGSNKSWLFVVKGRNVIVMTI